MAVHEYSFDCPECDQSESCSVVVHIHHGDVWAQEPTSECGCALTKEDKEWLMDCAIEEAEEDMWDLLDDADSDARYDRWVDQQVDDWYAS